MKLRSVAWCLLALGLPSLAAGPAPAPVPFDPASLDEKVTLGVREAPLQNVLERLADVLKVAPVIDPEAVDGKVVTLEASSTPIRAIVSRFESEFFLSIRIEGDRMVVREPLRPAKKSKEEQTSEDAKLLADTSIPRRSLGGSPPARPNQYALRLAEPGRIPSVFRLGDGLQKVTLPGCSAPLTLSVFGPDPWDREPRVAFVQGPADLARIGSPGKPARVAECPAEVEFLQPETPIPSPQVPESLPATGSLSLKATFSEVRPDGEARLAAGHYQIPSGQPFASSMHFGIEPGKPPLPRTSLWYMGAVLSVEEDSATFAFLAEATRDLEPNDGSGPVTVLLGRAEQTLRLRLGRKERVTISSTYRGGTSALVVDVEVERPPKR